YSCALQQWAIRVENYYANSSLSAAVSVSLGPQPSRPFPLWWVSGTASCRRLWGFLLRWRCLDLPNSDLFEYADQNICHHLSHVSLLCCCNCRHPPLIAPSAKRQPVTRAAL